MNSTLIKIGIAYIAGMITFAVVEDVKILDKLDKTVIAGEDTTKVDPLAGSCACINEPRYNVDPREESRNYPIDKVSYCQSMVNGTTPPSGGSMKGAWFSKITLDLIFCHAPDANGIFVYEGTIPGSASDPVYVVEASRTNKITTPDDGSSTIYYSRTLCPNICGRCGQ